MSTPVDPPPRRAFIIGAPRSGTSWLQALLGAHTLVATPQELDLFSRYLPPLWEAWNYELDRSPGDRIVGLIAALTQEELEDALRAFAATVHRRVLALKPTAALVLEKAPGYSLHVELIDRLVPDARYLHLIRDGRDVTASLVAAGRSWGRRWAPSGARDAAELWRAHVEGARTAAAFGDRYLELRYEDLLDRAEEQLLAAFGFLDLDADIALCRQVVDANRFAAAGEAHPLAPSILLAGEAERRFGRAAEPAGFVRLGRSGGWASTLTARELRICDDVAGDLLVALGYETGAPRARPRVRRAGAALERTLRRVARRAGRGLDSWGAS
jgi:Sulfotransferase family